MKYIVRILFEMTIASAALFCAAGRFDIVQFQSFLMLMLVVKLAALFVSGKELSQARTSGMRGHVDTRFDKAAMPLCLLGMVVAGLDVGRWHYGLVGASGIWFGFLGLSLCLCLSLWCMAVNPFFLPTIRWQPERGQYVVSIGPYEIVRHPGNLATIGVFLTTGVALGSWLSVAVHLVLVAMMVRRTKTEDRFLMGKLQGYREYAKMTTSRLLPGVW